jgi:hypothetical protein
VGKESRDSLRTHGQQASASSGRPSACKRWGIPLGGEARAVERVHEDAVERGRGQHRVVQRAGDLLGFPGGRETAAAGETLPSRANSLRAFQQRVEAIQHLRL